MKFREFSWFRILIVRFYQQSVILNAVDAWGALKRDLVQEESGLNYSKHN